MQFSLVSGWDSSTGWTTEQGAGSDGGIYSLQWKKVSDTVQEGEAFGTLDGKKTSEKDRLEKKGDRDFVVTCTERKVGEESLPDLTFVFRKAAPEKVKPSRAKMQRQIKR